MTQSIIILGTGSNSLELVEMLELPEFASLEVAGFLDDGMAAGERVLGLPVLGPLKDAIKFPDARFVNGIGSPGNHAVRHAFVQKTGVPDERFQTVVHPSASVSRRATIGHGTVLFQNVVVGTGARLGNHVIALPQTTVSHDTLIGDHTCLATGVILSGGCDIGGNCYLGAGCVIREKISIGPGSLIGAGAVVVKNVDPETKVAGNPARPM